MSKIFQVVPVLVLFMFIEGCTASPTTSSSSSGSSSGPAILSTWSGTVVDNTYSSTGTGSIILYADQTLKFSGTVNGTTASGSGNFAFSGNGFSASITGTDNNSSATPTTSPLSGTVTGSTNGNVMTGTYSMNFSAWSTSDNGSINFTEVQ